MGNSNVTPAEPVVKPRLSTYSKDWNKQCNRTSESLAEAGFYMVGRTNNMDATEKKTTTPIAKSEELTC
ncbi:unnamed protein product, partial [Medioppia subpectinata]